MRYAIIVVTMLLAALPARAADGIPDLPAPVANNAVASVTVEGRDHIFSFMGLGPGKTHTDIVKSAYMLRTGDAVWQQLPDVPVAEGRLAATAVGLNGRVWLFGGYTVAANGNEKSTPEVFAFDPLSLKYMRAPDMPLPVDDAVSFAYLDRYIYLVSGWHDTDNVRAVQVLDTQTMHWFSASDYPGTPVFGHAGGIIGNRFVIADGVAVKGRDAAGRRRFDTVNEGWMGTIDPANPALIAWRRLPQLPGRGHYRMAGAGIAALSRVVFVGGTPDAYNYSGVGYGGQPAIPTSHVFAWDFAADKWTVMPSRAVPSMDHRGLVRLEGRWFTLGGMTAAQQISRLVLSIR